MWSNITRKQAVITALCVLVLVGVGILAYRYHVGTEEALRQAQEMSAEQARDADTLRERLRVSEEQSERLAHAVERV